MLCITDIIWRLLGLLISLQVSHVLPHVSNIFIRRVLEVSLSISLCVPQTRCTPTRSRWSTCRESSGPTREVATAPRATSTPGSTRRHRKTSSGHTPLPSLPECSTNSANRYNYITEENFSREKVFTWLFMSPPFCFISQCRHFHSIPESVLYEFANETETFPTTLHAPEAPVRLAA